MMAVDTPLLEPLGDPPLAGAPPVASAAPAGPAGSPASAVRTRAVATTSGAHRLRTPGASTPAAHCTPAPASVNRVSVASARPSPVRARSDR